MGALSPRRADPPSPRSSQATASAPLSPLPPPFPYLHHSCPGCPYPPWLPPWLPRFLLSLPARRKCISFLFLLSWFLNSNWRSFNGYLFFLCPLLHKINIFQLRNIMNIIAYSHSEPVFVQSLIFIKFGFRNLIRSNVFRNSFKKLCSV